MKLSNLPTEACALQNPRCLFTKMPSNAAERLIEENLAVARGRLPVDIAAQLIPIKVLHGGKGGAIGTRLWQLLRRKSLSMKPMLDTLDTVSMISTSLTMTRRAQTQTESLLRFCELRTELRTAIVLQHLSIVLYRGGAVALVCHEVSNLSSESVEHVEHGHFRAESSPLLNRGSHEKMETLKL